MVSDSHCYAFTNCPIVKGLVVRLNLLAKDMNGPVWNEFITLAGTTPDIGPGARWISLDVHVHSPASNDYHDMAGGYEALAVALGGADLDAIVLTDHNTADGYLPLKKAVENLGVKTAIYPGAELSIPVPAILLNEPVREDRKLRDVFFHCLALLPPSESASEQIKAIVTAGLTRTDIWKLKPTERRLSQSIKEIARQVNDMGGLLVPAHLNQGKSPEKSKSFDDIYSDPNAIDLLETVFTSAVEIRNQSSLQFFDGSHKGKTGSLIPERGCLLGTDSHDSASVGTERNYLKVGSNCFEDIHAALRYRERIRFSAPPSHESRIETLLIQGQFLGNLKVDPNAELTALIGAKGSGKTAVLESIRYVLGLIPDSDQQAYLNHILGVGGRVWAVVNAGSYGRVLFVRRLGEGYPAVFAEDGTQLVLDKVRTELDVTIRGWGEVTRLAENREAQLRLIDGFSPAFGISEKTQALDSASAKTPAIFQQVLAPLQQLETVREMRDRLRDRASRLKRLTVSRVVDQQNEKDRRERERARFTRLLESLRSSLAADSAGLPAGFTELVAEVRDEAAIETAHDEPATPSIEPASSAPTSAQPISTITPNTTDLWQKTSTALSEFELSEGQTRSARRQAVAAAMTDIDDARTQFEERVAPAEVAYEQVVSTLAPHEREILLQRNQIVQETVELPETEARFNATAAEVKQKIRNYVDHLQSEHRVLIERSDAREQTISEINAALKSEDVPTKIRLIPAHSQAGGNVFTSAASELATMDPEVALAKLLPSGGLERINRPEFKAPPEDQPVIEFELYPGVWRQSDQLSAGQRSTAVLPLVLLLSRGPVILDQPEDNLDNRYIGTRVVPLFMREKERRQVVVTSHSATLVVMGDAELIIEMEDAAGRGRVANWGFLAGPHSGMRTPVITVLDGGEDAFNRRFRKYYAPE